MESNTIIQVGIAGVLILAALAVVGFLYFKGLLKGKNKIIVPAAAGIFVIIVIALFFTGFFEPKIQARELSGDFAALDEGAEKTENQFVYFELIKDKEISSLSASEVLELMDYGNSFGTPNCETIDGSVSCDAEHSNGDSSLKIMVFKFNDNFSAEKYFLSIESMLSREYDSVERLKYEDISSCFKARSGNYKVEKCLLKKGSFLIMTVGVFPEL